MFVINPKDFHATVVVVGLVLLGLQALFAWQENMLTPGQMRSANISKGVPLITHGGIVADIFLTLILACIASRYGWQWTRSAQIFTFAVGALMSFIIRKAYPADSTPIVNWSRAIYTAATISILMLFYLATKKPDYALMWITTGFVTVRVAVGNDFVLGFIAPERCQSQPLHDRFRWLVVIGSGIILAISTYEKVGI
jgi:hypothetical protein